MYHQVRAMTRDNHHCEARVHVATHVLRDPELATWYQAALDLRNRQGYLAPGQSEAIYQLDQQVLRPRLEAGGYGYYWDAL